MKHGLITLGAVAVAAALSLPATVHAADVPSKTSTATLQVNAPAGNLTLEQAPSFTFSTDKAVNDAALPNTATDNLVKVDDERGTGAGWTLNLQVGKFADLASQPGYFSWSGNEASAVAPNVAPTTSNVTQTVPGSDAVTLETVAPKTGTGETTLAMKNVTLTSVTLPAINATYTADLTWTLGTTETSN
ncbi:WxL domain-containing protein [Lacticaseibacillus nasuensis]|uniref:WxL domain-containing protein n=1 Tax=Lacticaseibacillus nasuensis TaxID=944671 RepID=UPI0022459175|nr:WxL domain-containing protein [Lacticaseibacillus nasuensis]MCX2455882.1 WxL domain-containing protein [Lacticaseibacillus nasuensis]